MKPFIATITSCETFDVSKNGNSRVVFTATELDGTEHVAYSPIDSMITNQVRNAYRTNMLAHVTIALKRDRWTLTDITEGTVA